MKLRSKILLALLIVGMPLVVVNAWWIARQQDRERERVLDRLRRDAGEASVMVQAFLADLGDRGEQTAVRAPEAPGLPEYLRDRWAYLRFWNPNITGLVWADPEGQVVAGVPGDSVRRGVRFVGRESLEVLGAGHGWALDDLMSAGEERERASETLHLVARSGPDTARGMVGILFTPQVFQPLFRSTKFWARIRLADRSGRLVYATDRLKPSLEERFRWAEAPGLRDTLYQGATTVQSGRIPDDAQGADWMVAHVRIPQTGWVATALVPTAEALAESRRSLYGEVAIQAALVALCVAAAFLVAQRVAAPARRLALVAQRIAGGDQTARVGLAGADEMATVGRAFDEMAEALETSWTTLKAERDAAKDAADRLVTLSMLDSLANSSLDPSQVFDFIAKATSQLLEGATVLLLAAEDDQGPLRLCASFADMHPELRVQNEYRPSEGLVGWVLQHREVLLLDDMLADGRTLNRAWAEAEGLRAFAGVPLLVRGRCLGVLYAARGGDRPFAPRDAELLKSFAAHAAIAVQNAQLYQRVESEAQRLRAVLESMPVAVAVGEGRPEDGTIRFAMGNRAFAELEGTQALISGAGLPECRLRRPDGSPVPDEELPLQRAIWQGEATKEEEFTLTWADGRRRALLVNAVPFPEMDGTRRAVSVILDITERRQVEEELKRLAADNAALFEQAAREAATKGLLLEELNHRVRNNLALIVSFLELQRATPAGRQAAAVLEEAISRVKGLALVHNVLGGTGFQAGQYEALVHRLAEQTFLQGPLRGRVELAVEMQPLRLPSRELTALGIITNELFTNIAKHAFPNGRRGVVAVGVETLGSEAVIRVRDDGAAQSLDSAEGTGGLGLRLIRSLVEVSLQGTFTLEGGGGTTAVIRFPLPAGEATRGGR